MQIDRYCEHFKNLKITKNINLNEVTTCKYCINGKNYLWLCLSKNCGLFLCDRNQKEHMLLHLEQMRTKKAFHSIFINILTAKIFCVHCHIQIYDLDQLKIMNKLNENQNPYPLRLKILPALAQFDTQKNKINGQLENSEGHRRINKALTGFFGDKYNHSINSAVQFLMQFKYYRSLLFELHLPNQAEILKQLRNIFLQAESAQLRAIRTDELTKILYERFSQLVGYSRKDPFEHVLMFMNLLHEEIKYYSAQSLEEERDPWNLLSQSDKKAILNCPLFDSISCTLNLNYECEQCSNQATMPVNINFIKLSFPRKKRKPKEVEKQLAEHRATSPIKHRRNSLINFFIPEQNCPYTVPQLLIQLLKQPLHKEQEIKQIRKDCLECKKKLKHKKPYFSNLSEYLFILINRMGKDGNSIDDTALQLDLGPLDMGPFTQNGQNVILYNLETAICLEKGCLFPVIAESEFNKQMYIFKNQMVNMLKTQKNAVNPYILCYKRKSDEATINKARDAHSNVLSNVMVQGMNDSKQYKVLPDFWLNQLKFNIAKRLQNQLVCCHGYRKPHIVSKMVTPQKVPIQVYEYLLQEYDGDDYLNKECQTCSYQLMKIIQRRKKEKEKIVELDKIKTNCYCMITTEWIKKWINYLYKKEQYAYFPKGYSFPGRIENKILLDNGKCKKNLIRNVDYKVVNIFVWKFLKDLYGGGPQIRYRWNQNDMKKGEEELLLEVRRVAKEIKQIFIVNDPQSPKKTVIIERTASFVESRQGSEIGDELYEKEEEDEY